MALNPGFRIGPYEVIAKLGEGGMGEVYRATDSNLKRAVALKVLPASVAADSDRLARFQREAEVLASLNHPNIAAIYGLERAGATTALAMELVEGEDLSIRMARGPIARADALPIVRQIAEALEAAHEQGIVHRDLKPANIKVRGDGAVKVLDFGLAKAVDAGAQGVAASGATISPALKPTMTSPALLRQGFGDAGTGVGIILGTAAYMSPEQAKGRAVDKRADIWAFGVVLFEMLTGRPLYQGETVSEVLAAVIKDAPDFSTLPADTPHVMRAILARCLERDPRKRLRDIGEARILLESPNALDVTAVSVIATRKSRSPVLWVAGLAGALAAGAAIAWVLTPSVGVDLPVRRFEIHTPDRLRVIDAAISPDGRAVAFTTVQKTWIKRLDRTEPIEIPGGAARGLFWSPDSVQLGFQARGRLWKVPASGGTPIEIGAVSRDFSVASGAMWLPGNRIVYSTGSTGLLETSADGGETKELLAPDSKSEVDFHEPSALPDGKGILFVPHTNAMLSIELFDGRARREIYRGTSRLRFPVYSPTGHLLFSRDGTLWAVPFDLATEKVSGDPFLVAADAGRPTVSNDGTLVVVPEGAPSDMQLTWVDREGKVTGTLGRGGIAIRYPRVSPDGRQVAALITGPQSDLYVFDIAKGTDRRLTFEPGPNTDAAWSPDGKFVVYRCGTAVCSRAADGSGGPVKLVDNAYSPTVSRDGTALLFVRDGSAATLSDIFIVALGPQGLAAPATGTSKPLIAGSGRQVHGEISPDGKLLAYESTETGEAEIYLTTFPDARGKWQVSKAGGSSPRWSRAGDRVYFDAANHLMESMIERTPAPAPATPKEVLAAEAIGVRLVTFGYDRGPDDGRFLMPRPTNATSEIGAVLLIEQWAKMHVGK